MSGILDSKSRVLDTILTLEGKKQLARGGGLDIKYVTFSDSATHYSADIASGSSDATVRLYFEACNLPQDQISFTADDSGTLNVFPNSDNDVTLKSGRIIRTSVSSSIFNESTGSLVGYEILTGSAFASIASNMLTSSIDNFQKLQIIGSVNSTFEDKNFSINPKSVQFLMSDVGPIAKTSVRETHVNNLESLFVDPRFSNAPNFKYMPPVMNTPNKDVIANYKCLGLQTNLISQDDINQSLVNELKKYESFGYCKTISIDPTSRQNRLMCQMFEISHDTMKKLDVIDYGIINVAGARKHIFFVGKVFIDNNGSQNFVNMFTMVFELCTSKKNLKNQ